MFTCLIRSGFVCGLVWVWIGFGLGFGLFVVWGLKMGGCFFFYPSIEKIYTFSSKIDFIYLLSPVFSLCFGRFLGFSSNVHRCDNIYPMQLPCMYMCALALLCLGRMAENLRFPFVFAFSFCRGWLRVFRLPGGGYRGAVWCA